MKEEGGFVLNQYWNTWYGNVAEPDKKKKTRFNYLHTLPLSVCSRHSAVLPGEGSGYIQEPLGLHLLQGKGVTTVIKNSQCTSSQHFTFVNSLNPLVMSMS